MGLSPAPVLCQVLFVQQVLEGCFFFLFPFSPSLRHCPNIQPLSSSGEPAWLLGELGALPCTLGVLHGEDGQGRGDADTAHAHCTGEHWPGLAWEVSDEAVRTTSLPPWQLLGLHSSSQSPVMVGSRVHACLISHWFSPFPGQFASPMATPPDTCPGKGAGSLGTPRTLQEVSVIPKRLKSLGQEGLYRPCTGAHLLCSVISGDEPYLGAWSPGLLSSTDIWGNDAQGSLFWVTEGLFYVRGGLSRGLGVTGATLQTAGLAPTGTLTL